MTLHLILQGKGGVGKSFAAVHFAQFLRHRNLDLALYDVDILNSTLSQFSDLGASRIELVEKDDPNRIRESRFDFFLRALLEDRHDHVIVDVGSSTIAALMAHLVEIDFFSLQEELGFAPVIHIPVTGGQSLDDTLANALRICNHAGEAARYVLWDNPLFGPVEHEGRPLEEMAFVRKIQDGLIGIVHIPQVLSDPLAEDIQDMMRQKLTYREVMDNPDWFIFRRSRLNRYRQKFFDAMEPLVPHLMADQAKPAPSTPTRKSRK